MSQVSDIVSDQRAVKAVAVVVAVVLLVPAPSGLVIDFIPFLAIGRGVFGFTLFAVSMVLWVFIAIAVFAAAVAAAVLAIRRKATGKFPAFLSDAADDVRAWKAQRASKRAARQEAREAVNGQEAAADQEASKGQDACEEADAQDEPNEQDTPGEPDEQGMCEGEALPACEGSAPCGEAAEPCEKDSSRKED